MELLQGFRIKVIAYLSIITLVLIVMAYAINQGGSLLHFSLLLLTLTALLLSLFRLVNKTNTDISQFLLGIKYNDFEQAFPVNRFGTSHKNLYQAFNLINNKFRQIRSEQVIQQQLLENIIQHVDTGILCTDAKGKTLVMNQALKEMLHKSHLPSLNAVEKFAPKLFDLLADIAPGQRELIKLNISNELCQLTIQKQLLKTVDQEFHIYSFYNLEQALSDQELQSWQKLIRVLAHEIMNSVTPIVSLSAAVQSMLPEEEAPSPQLTKEVREAFALIQRRSEGLLDFTDNYRKLTRVPAPQWQSIKLKSLLEEIHRFFQPMLQEKNIQWQLQFLYPNLELLADPNLLEQVLINIIKNAVEALEGQSQPSIQLSLDKRNDGKVLIQIIDNGHGVPADIADQVFVPFFTTKEEGSGVGLSLSQQIMRLHGGALHLQSVAGQGTKVSLVF